MPDIHYKKINYLMKRLFVTCILLTVLLSLAAQESLLKSIEDTMPVKQKIYGAFKSTRVINAHSTEMLAKGNLDFRILHRFGRVNSGIRQFYGLDQASMRMSFDYGITDNVMVGIGRSTLRKDLDGFIKTRIVQQSTGPGSFPLSVLVAAGTIVYTEQAKIVDASGKSINVSVADRSSHYLQLIAGRKFNDRFSFQLSPVLLHRNLVKEYLGEANTVVAIGGGARYKFSKRMALMVDYHHVLSGIMATHTNAISAGVDIETGGHVFQLHFSNSAGMNERAYLTENTENFFNGDIHFGFNLSRIFKVGGKKKW